MENLLLVALFAVLLAGSFATGWFLSWAQEQLEKRRKS